MEIIGAACLYTTETNLVLFKLDCYEFKMFLVIPKAIRKYFFRNTQERKESKWCTIKKKSTKGIPQQSSG